MSDGYADDADDAPTDMKALGATWMTRIIDAEKREESWRMQAESAEKTYLADDDTTIAGKVYDFNILHSNIETMMPATYNSAPLPDIRERFRTGRDTPEGATAKAVAQIYERAIMVQSDDGALDIELEGMAKDALIAGRGIIRVRFEADEQVDPATGQEVVTNERLTFECVPWRDYREGAAKRWNAVPWVAYRHCVTKLEYSRIKDPEIKEAVGDPEYGESEDDTSDAYIWEVWDKETGKVLMIAEKSCKVIKMTDDPYGLKGFFPSARPVQPVTLAGRRTPVTPFSIYRKQADELELITRRIKGIMDGIKVRGMFIGSAAAIQELAEAGDNTLIPVADLEGLAQTGGLDSAISWWPIDKAIQVLRELYIARDATKSTIYEVTGISDVVRGASNPNETLGAQEIKAQVGGLRMRGLQKQIERAGRDVFVICAELIASKFSAQTLQAISGVQITPEMQGMIQRPLDHYRIDVETNSTVRADLTRRRGEMSEFLQGTASYFSTMAPLVAQAPTAAEPLIQLYAAFARTHAMGKQADDALEDLVMKATEASQQPQQPQPDPAMMEAQMQAEAKKAELQMQAEANQAKMQIEMQKMQMEMQLKQAQMQADMQMRQAEVAMKREQMMADVTLAREKMAIEAMPQQAQQGPDMAALVNAILQGQAAMMEAQGQQLAALVAEIQRGNSGVVAAMLAPKEVIRDAEGRPVGVQARVN